MKIASISGQEVNVLPLHDLTCPQQPCFTLSDLALRSNLTSNVTNVIFYVIPGSHILDHELIVSDANNISIGARAADGGDIIIRCINQGRFMISSATTVSVWGLHFIGCGGNRVTQVNNFLLQDTIFHGLENSTALTLHEISTVNIIVCSYFNNIQGSNIQEFEVPLFVKLLLGDNNIHKVGGAIITINSNVNIDNVMFDGNSAQFGGAIFVTKSSNVSITNSQFFSNNASNTGFGVLFVDQDCSLQVSNSTFSKNMAGFGIISLYKSTVAIRDSSMFASNTVFSCGGAVFAYNGSVQISDSKFSNNRGERGGAVAILGGLCDISGSNFDDNTANLGGALFLNKASVYGPLDVSEGSLIIVDSNFNNNKAETAGGVISSAGGLIYIADSMYSNNMAPSGGVVFTVSTNSLHIVNSIFVNNTAMNAGGVMYSSQSGSLTIANSIFSGNKAILGGITHVFDSQMMIADCYFEKTITSYIGSMYVFLATINISGNTTFTDNYGSLYCFNCNITISGYTRFENGRESTASITQEGGAITSLLSNVILAGTMALIHNEARYGGALLAIESTTSVSGQIEIANNTATAEGGGLYLRQSTFELKQAQFTCFFSHNTAIFGGGIHAISSTIIVNQPAALHLENNVAAETGGGMYLTGSSKINLLRFINDENTYSALTFTENHAATGGAMFVDDNSNSGACRTTTECFIQSISLDPQFRPTDNQVVLYFADNNGTENGPSIFGGLLNSCTPSQFATGQEDTGSGTDYIKSISNVTLDSITSLPVQICYCNDQMQPDCNYQPPPIQIKKGGELTVSLIAVDQVKHPVEANITSFLYSNEGGFEEGQQIQSTSKSCTNLTFNVFSPLDREIIGLYAEGPCGNSELAVRNISILFTNCICPIGFKPSNSPSRCECICDTQLAPHITICNESTSSLLRVGTNSWITYVGDSNFTGYIIRPVCPFDYCRPVTDNVSVNLNVPGGANAQCAHNRRGVLCGACQPNLSLSLGSSRCLSCNKYWPAVLVVIIMAAMVAGIMLVATLLALNLTVAGGHINIFIFYANMIAASNSAYFSFSGPSIPTLFVAWLNLDIGFDVCFYNGLDAYVKSWLQLAFPIYIITLVVLVIAISECSLRFAKLIGKRDPIATLSTLILLSYTKLLSTTILVFSFDTLIYPNGTRVDVWLPDGNIEFYEGKRIVFVIVAFFIIFIGLLYTVLLLSWQWIIRAPRWRILRWTRNTKLNAFIATYHVPYNAKYRYWTGLLLVVRVILYITAAFTASGNPQVPLLTTIILIGGLFLFKEITGMRVYRKLPTDIIESVMYFNLLAFASFSLYDLQSGNNTKQAAVSYISTIIAFIFLTGIIIWHVILVLRRRKHSETTQTLSTVTVSDSPQHAEVTFTSVAIPYREAAIVTSSI